MSEYFYIDVEEALKIVKSLGAGPVRDIGLLDSALARPQSSAFGEDAYPTLQLKAAALMHSLIKNHSLIDGNKRLSFVATNIFFLVNGYRLEMSTDESYQLVLDIASGDVDLEIIAARLVATKIN
jgi:death on curing protein